MGGEIYAFAWMGTALGSAVIASNKNRSGCLWFFFGLVAGPFALAITLLLKKAEPTPLAEEGETP